MQFKRKIGITGTDALCVIALIVVLHFLTIAIVFSDQPPIDAHSFRQSQTAISTYWLVREGFTFAYPTPVVGKPWAIPFEFPLYQYIAATIVRITGWDLNTVSRLVSTFFVIACIFPVHGTLKISGFTVRTSLLFIILFLSSPIYMYWGRSIMIETTALFFTLCSIYFFESCYKKSMNFKNISLFFVCALFAFLQKITTALPVFVALAAIASYREIAHLNKHRTVNLKRSSILFFFGFFIPSFIGYKWVVFTDDIKRSNPIGEFLTSEKISEWNWGNLSQKLNIGTYKLTLLDRFAMSDVLSFFILISVLICIFLLQSDTKRIKWIFATVFVYFLPVIIFTNLHLVRNYYQTANAIFFIMTISIVIDSYIHKINLIKIGYVLLLAIAAGNIYNFYVHYYSNISQDYYSGNRDFIVGQTVRSNTPEGSEFVAFGDDWSAVIPYIGERKALMVPDWYPGRPQVLDRVDTFLDHGRMSLVLSCGAAGLPNGLLFNFASGRNWSTGRVTDCLIAFQPQSFIAPNATRTHCVGYLDDLSVEKIDGKDILHVKGWTTMSHSAREFPETSYIELSGASGRRYVQALRVPAPTVNDTLGVSRDEIAGFSALIPLREGEKNLQINIAQRSGEISEVCEFDRDISL
jgi:4-amino-4-deoxy-L-arabinose transferase-like glycosyltransferase